MANEITFVGAGTSAATDGATAPTPTLPSGLVTDDFMVAFFYSREIVDGTVSISAGWSTLINNRDSGGLMAIFYRFYVGGDTAPTFTLGGHAANDTTLAHIAAWRGVSSSNLIDSVGLLSTNAAAIDIGPIAGISLGRKALAIAFGGKLDDFTSVFGLAAGAGEDQTWNEIAEPDSTLGNDAGMVWSYAINPGLEDTITDKTFDVSGGTSVAGKGVLLSFNLDAPAFTVADYIVPYCASSHPQTDSASPGGGVDTSMRAVFTDLAVDDDIEVLSDDVDDVGISILVRGRDSSENAVQQLAQLNGTTAVILSTLGVIDRIQEVILTDLTEGNITVRRSVSGATIGVIPSGELGFRRVFRSAYPHPTQSKLYYEKIFLRNNHPTVTLQSAVISESADPSGSLVFTLDALKDDDSTSETRLDAPSTDDTDPDTFDASAKSVPEGGGLDPFEVIGIWLRITVDAAETPFKNTYTLGVSGAIL